MRTKGRLHRSSTHQHASLQCDLYEGCRTGLHGWKCREGCLELEGGSQTAHYSVDIAASALCAMIPMAVIAQTGALTPDRRVPRNRL